MSLYSWHNRIINTSQMLYYILSCYDSYYTVICSDTMYELCMRAVVTVANNGNMTLVSFEIITIMESWKPTYNGIFHDAFVPFYSDLTFNRNSFHTHYTCVQETICIGLTCIFPPFLCTDSEFFFFAVTSQLDAGALGERERLGFFRVQAAKVLLRCTGVCSHGKCLKRPAGN